MQSVQKRSGIDKKVERVQMSLPASPLIHLMTSLTTD